MKFWNVPVYALVILMIFLSYIKEEEENLMLGVSD